MVKPSDYKAISFWGNCLGSFSSYIKQEQYKAVVDNAPLNAIYKRNNDWVTLNDVTNESIISEAKILGLM